MTVATDFELVGRENELGQLARSIDDLHSGARAALIRGEAGIGKTVLWRAGIQIAQQAGMRVLVTRCAEAEIPLALGGLADLLDGVLPEVAEELAGPQRRALAVAVGVEATADETPDLVALPRAFLACLRALAGRTPVLLAIDDVQWLDPPSQRILAFAAGRLGDAPVGILATQRGDGGDPLELRHAFEERSNEIRVGPMSVGALHRLIRTRLGLRIPRPVLARVQEASGGNPMFALEFAQVAASAGAPLPVPSSLEELVRERVGRLPPELLPLLAAAAAVERPTPSLLGAVIDDASDLLDAASAVGAVTVGLEGVVRFTHPLLASAAYAAVPPAARRALHARLAAASDDLEERARHLALSIVEPDAEVARLLDGAAAQARSRGAPDAAATLARHALRVTPPDDVVGCEERAVAVATYLTDAGQMASADALLDELLAGPISGTRRGRALLLKFLAASDLDQAIRFAEEALEHAGDDPELRLRALLFFGTIPLERDGLDGYESHVAETLAAAEALGDPILLALALMRASHVADLRRRPEPSLLERATALAGGRRHAKGLPTPRLALAQQRLWAGDLASARELLDAELAAARDWGDAGFIGGVLKLLVDLEWRAGAWVRAEQYLEEHWQLAFDGGNRWHEAVVLSQQGIFAASRGRVEEARRLALETIGVGEELHFPWLEVLGRWALGFLALSSDEPAAAFDALGSAPEAISKFAGGRESEQWPILADALEAAVGVGRLDEAEAALATFERQAHGRERRWAGPAVSRCRALLLLARGESEAALAAAEQAALGFQDAGFPLDEARALLVAGEALKRLGERRRAAEKLEASKELFAHLGAPLWLARAAKELSRARPRPRSDRELTSAERRVAALVAAGRTNREVSAQLFTTVGTVEVHLTRIYRKLGLRSRTELARGVADGTLDLEDA